MEVNLVDLEMITFKKACQLIETNVKTNDKNELINVDEAHSRIIVDDYYSKFDLPFANLSAMDGIVVNKKSLDINKRYFIKGESKSGDLISKNFKNNECKLIFTGAPLPKGKMVVIPKENCDYYLKHNFVKIRKIPQQTFIRNKGSDIRKKAKFLKKNTILSIRKIALAKALMINKVKVIPKPKICIISTGDELINRKNPTVAPTNHILLKYLATKFGAKVLRTDIVKDNENEFVEIVKTLNDFDLLITTGGISEGKYDVVKNSFSKLGLKIFFNKISIKPGKPTSFGKFSEGRYFLGLPGNPVSCFVSMINFFPIFIKKFFGKEILKINKSMFKSSEYIEKNGKLTTFQRVRCSDGEFKIFKSQDSSMQHILSESNGLIQRTAFEKPIRKNQMVEIITFDNITEYNI